MKRLIEVLRHFNLTKLTAIAALTAAMVSISASAILVRLSELEVSPYATTFHRFWLTALILGLWSGMSALRRWSSASIHESQELSACSPIPFLHREEVFSSPQNWGGIRGTEILEQPVKHVGMEDTTDHQGKRFTSTNNFQTTWQLLAAGTLIAADLVLWAWSLTQTSVANSTLLANLTPLFTCLGGWLLCGKRLDRQLVIGAAIAIAGTTALSLEDLSFSPVKFHGDIAALLAAVSFGLYLLLLEQLKPKFSASEIVGWSSAIAAGLTAPIVFLSPEHLLPVSWQGWLSIISLVMICQILGQSLLVYSLDHLSAEFAAVFLLLDPVLAAIAAWILFAERLDSLSWFAFAVVLTGIYIALTGQSAPEKTPRVSIADI